MSDYIKREDAISAVKHAWAKGLEPSQYIEIIPAADVAPVVHAKWIEYPRPHYFKCSNCKYTVPYRKAVLHNREREYNSCPSCGAKMDLED